jgi:LmbE family N-acetylglucosaminyl deacetylase
MLTSLLARLASGENISHPVVLVAAHPDDEILGAGSRLHLLEQLTLIHVTDGAPRNLKDALAYGFQSAEEYAAARRAELRDALRVAGAEPIRMVELGIHDQEAAANLADVARRLAELFARMRPAFVMTHPYEGGHPDHDATAFAVHAASTLGPRVEIAEFTSYHREVCRFITGAFLGEHPVETAILTPTEQRHKRLMFDCFVTQRETLAQFSVETERFRVAPQYDFTAPPHEGRLHYEHCNWGMTGDRFRELARAALEELRTGAAA